MDSKIIKQAHQAWCNAQNQRIDFDFAQSKLFKIKKTEGFTGMKGDTIYIAFQGTADFFDGLSDINILTSTPFLISQPNVKVHSGFLKQFLTIEDFIIQTAMFNKNIVLSGQSLGGSLAEIAAIYIKRFNPNINIKVVTWAKPKCFNKTGVKYYNSLKIETMSYQYRNDMIPKLPPFYSYTTEPIVYGEPLKWYEKLLIGGNPFLHTLKNYINKFQEII